MKSIEILESAGLQPKSWIRGHLCRIYIKAGGPDVNAFFVGDMPQDIHGDDLKGLALKVTITGRSADYQLVNNRRKQITYQIMKQVAEVTSQNIPTSWEEVILA